MKQDKSTSESSSQPQSNEDPMHGAAVINAKGEETPITEDMIQQALKNILKACQ